MKRVYVPDRSTPFELPDSLTNEEIRQSLAGMGHTSVNGAELVEENGGQTIRFRRVTGGSKGL